MRGWLLRLLLTNDEQYLIRCATIGYIQKMERLKVENKLADPFFIDKDIKELTNISNILWKKTEY